MRLLTPILLAAALAAPLSAPAFADEPGRITVTGEAAVQVAPDIATLSLGVTTEGTTAAEALSANNAALAAVLERLKGAGIAERDIQTSNLSVNPNWAGGGYSSAEGAKITGFTASNIVTVTVRDLTKLGDVLDKAVADGANTLNGLSFGLAEPKPALDEARKKAVAEALDRAKLLTGAAGVEAGKIVSISENTGFQSPMPMMRAASAKADSVPLAQGELDMSASVTIVLELK